MSLLCSAPMAFHQEKKRKMKSLKWPIGFVWSSSHYFPNFISFSFSLYIVSSHYWPISLLPKAQGFLSQLTISVVSPAWNSLPLISPVTNSLASFKYLLKVIFLIEIFPNNLI